MPERFESGVYSPESQTAEGRVMAWPKLGPCRLGPRAGSAAPRNGGRLAAPNMARSISPSSSIASTGHTPGSPSHSAIMTRSNSSASARRPFRSLGRARLLAPKGLPAAPAKGPQDVFRTDVPAGKLHPLKDALLMQA